MSLAYRISEIDLAGERLGVRPIPSRHVIPLPRRALHGRLAFVIGSITVLGSSAAGCQSARARVGDVPLHHSARPARAPRWETLPAPPPLPAPVTSGMAPVNGIRMHYAVFGHGSPVLLIHNGLGDADDWGGVVPRLAPRYRVIIADTRGFGRSTRDATPYSYRLLASDYLALLDYLGVRRVALVGTSDGGIIGLDIGIHHPERLVALFIQGANATADGIQPAPVDTQAVLLALRRARAEYLRLSATPQEYAAFRAALDSMDAREPSFSDAELRSIHVPTTVAVADHEESILPSHSRHLARIIPGARFVILRDVSHFAPLQDPIGFARAVALALDRVRSGWR